MHEIKKEDWDRILDEKNAHFEEDFRTLMKRYIKNTEIAIQKEKFWILIISNLFMMQALNLVHQEVQYY